MISLEWVSIGYLVVVFLLLFGTTKKVKTWYLSIYAGIVAVFIIGELIIKFITGFFQKGHSDWATTNGPITLGYWVVPFYILLAIALLVLIDFRLIKRATRSEITTKTKWIPIILTILFNLIYIGFGCFVLFFVTFMFFPFGP